MPQFGLPSGAVPLATSGSGQDPAAIGSTTTVGTQGVAARADHVHTPGMVGRLPLLGLLPPAYAQDYVLDGGATITIPNNGYGFFNTASGALATLSGSTYTLASNLANFPAVVARNFTLNAGITLKPASSSGYVIIAASQAITINGTIDCSGAAGSGATGGTGAAQGASFYRGFAGGNGGTGAGVIGASDFGSQLSVGSGSGAGGASGTPNAGGGSRNRSGLLAMGADALLYLKGGASASQTFTSGPPGGGAGGGSGGGDGANAGGGGGAGGGIIILIAPQITIGAAAVLTVKGGNGAAGVAGNAGGGGGGGGGAIAVHGLKLSITTGAQMIATGGTGGGGSGTGVAGSPGAPGNGTSSFSGSLFYDPPTANGGFGFGQGVLICQWQ